MDENLMQRAYTYIVAKLASGELGPGTQLSNRKLASEIGVSVIPVREAINRLESEGFVERRAGVGSFVPMPSYDELMDIYDLREAVECHALKKAAGVVNTELLSELSSCVDAMANVYERLEQGGGNGWTPESLEQWSSADASFHDTIVAASSNRRALETIRNLRKMSRIFGKRVANQPLAMLCRSLEDHRRIVDALGQGDTDKAVSLLAEHIRHGCRCVLEMHRSRRPMTAAMRTAKIETVPEAM